MASFSASYFSFAFPCYALVILPVDSTVCKPIDSIEATGKAARLVQMTNSTRFKFIAICVNVSLICFSLTILASLYVFSVSNQSDSNINQFKEKQSESVAATNSSRSLRHPGEENLQQQQKSHDDSKPPFAYLPSLLQSFINWLGKSVISSSAAEEGAFEETPSLFTAGRPLVAVASLWYVTPPNHIFICHKLKFTLSH